MTPVEQIAELVDYGVTDSASSDPSGPKFLRITDIQQDRVDWSAVPYCSPDAKGIDKAELASGDIVFARTGATTGKSFLVDSPPKGSVFASYLIRLRLGPAAEPAYVAHFFRSPGYWRQITNFSEGVAQPGVNATKLKQVRIPLPGIEEQRRIAAVLDAADDLRTKRRQALAKLDTLTQAIFINMFGDPIHNPMGFPVEKMAEHVHTATYGTSKKASTHGELPVLRMGNITYEGRLDLTDMKYVELDEKDYAKHTVEPGDVLFNRTNSADLVGKTTVFRQSDPMAFAGYLVRLRTTDSLSSDYLGAFMNLPSTKQTLRGMCKSIVGMANINAKEVQRISLPIPPISSQLEFAAMREQVEQRRNALLEGATTLDSLFASLQQRAFRGEL